MTCRQRHIQDYCYQLLKYMYHSLILCGGSVNLSILHICPAGEKATVSPVEGSQLLSNSSVTAMLFALIWCKDKYIYFHTQNNRSVIEQKAINSKGSCGIMLRLQLLISRENKFNSINVKGDNFTVNFTGTVHP